MSPQTPTPTVDYAETNGERYRKYYVSSPISDSRVAGSVNRCKSEASDDRTTYSPI